MHAGACVERHDLTPAPLGLTRAAGKTRLPALQDMVAAGQWQAGKDPPQTASSLCTSSPHLWRLSRNRQMGLLSFRRGYLHGTTREYGRLLTEHLEAVAGALQHKDPVLIINVYRYGPLERLLTRLQTLGSRPTSHHHRIQLHAFPAPLGQRGLASQLGDKTAIGIEHLQAVVLEVGHVNGSILIHGDAGGPIELAITLSRSAKLHQKPAIWGEFLHAIVAPVGHVHIPMLVNIDAPGYAELAVTAAAATPLEQELPLLGEDLNPVIPAVHHIEVVIRTKGQPGGAVNFTVASTGRPPFADPVSVFGEDGDAVEPLIGHVGVALAVQRDRCRPEEGAIAGGGNGLLRVNFFTELSDVFFFYGADGDPLAGPKHRGLSAAAEHVQPVAFAPGYCHRMEEPVPAPGFLPSDRMAILEC